MLQLEPLEDFFIVRGLSYLDGNTNYIQAVIRNAKTDAIIATVNLADKGDQQRFSTKWQVPQDPTGLGLYIIITTSVYTDNSYTTKSQNFGDDFETYLVQRRMNASLGVGGGDGVSYKAIRQIVQEELGKLPKPQEYEMPEQPNIPFHIQPVLNALAGIRSDIGKIELPETDFSGVEHRLNTLEDAIKGIKMPETDLSPVLNQMTALEETVKAASLEKTGEAGQQILERIKQFFLNDMDAIKAQISGLETKFDNIVYIAFKSDKGAATPTPPPDYSLLK